MRTVPGIYRYGSERGPGEGLRIGVTRHPPRGVKKEDWARLGYCDLWFPLLAPSAELVKAYRGGTMEWEVFARRYRAEMRSPECGHLIALLAAFAERTPLSLGCFCEDESRCHRSVLRELVGACLSVETGGRADSSAPGGGEGGGYASPACWANWDDLD